MSALILLAAFVAGTFFGRMGKPDVNIHLHEDRTVYDVIKSTPTARQAYILKEWKDENPLR